MVVNALHFARATPLPDAVRDWHRLGELAAQLRDQRVRAYPAMIADGRMTASGAATRLRIITAIAAQWDAVLRGQALPPVEDYREKLGADAADMLDECADIAVRADARTAAAAAALADPENTTVKQADVRRCADQAMLAGALHWHQQPINDGAIHPHIWIAHDFHQWQRHQRATAARAA